jgi:hypothetical protein
MSVPRCRVVMRTSRKDAAVRDTTPEDPPVENCRCNRELPKPGRVLIAVFCADCDGYMSYVAGDIDEQLDTLDKIRRIIHTARAVDAAVASARQWPARRPPEDTGTTVTMTEVYGDEGFRPFG